MKGESLSCNHHNFSYTDLLLIVDGDKEGFVLKLKYVLSC